MKKLKQKIYSEQSRRIILKGIPASPGIAQGEAKIILFPSECKKMKKRRYFSDGNDKSFIFASYPKSKSNYY